LHRRVFAPHPEIVCSHCGHPQSSENFSLWPPAKSGIQMKNSSRIGTVGTPMQYSLGQGSSFRPAYIASIKAKHALACWWFRHAASNPASAPHTINIPVRMELSIRPTSAQTGQETTVFHCKEIQSTEARTAVIGIRRAEALV